MKENRLFSLDMLRGIDMIYLTVISGVLSQVFRATGMEKCHTFFCSHPWGGVTLYDLIMPLFIFMCGAAVPIALSRRLKDGKTNIDYWKHVFSRVVLLWVLGMIAQGNLTTLDACKISPYNNTLQTIAVGYVVAAALLPVKRLWVRIAVPAAMALTYGLIIHFCGDYTSSGNATVGVEKAVLSILVPENSILFSQVYYTWFLPSLMFPVITMAGCFSVEILQLKTGEWRRAAYLAAFGASTLLAGWILSLAGVAVVKQIFTVSFTFIAVGISILLLAALYVIGDILKFRRGSSVVLLFGQFALAAYVVNTIAASICDAVVERFFSGLNALFPDKYVGVAKSVELGIIVVISLIVWRGYKLSRSRNAK